MTKAERRAAAKAAAARASARKRRQQALLGVLAGLAVVGVLVASFVVFGGADDGDPAESEAAAPATPPAATAPGQAAPPAPGASAPAGAPAFPPLPPGADPALASKPAARAGTGTLARLTATPLIEGTGPAARPGQQITVNYVGVRYQTGEEFDASWTRAEPFTFQLGGGQVIPGWDQGLVGAKVGSRVQLDIPANLAYGDNPAGGAPGGPLRFIVDVLALR